MASRFVILHHQLDDGEHWDFMLERGEVLLTWRLDREPIDRSALPLKATRIEDHRRVFLTYEGPISGRRGVVSRVDEGTALIERFDEDHIVMELRGLRLRGHVELRADGDRDVLDALR